MCLSARNRPVRVFKVTRAGKKHLEQELASIKKMFAGIYRALRQPMVEIQSSKGTTLVAP